MKIGTKTMLLYVYINVSIDLLYKKITSMIAYLAAVAKYNLARKEYRAARIFCTSSYVS